MSKKIGEVYEGGVVHGTTMFSAIATQIASEVQSEYELCNRLPRKERGEYLKEKREQLSRPKNDSPNTDNRCLTYGLIGFLLGNM